MFAQSCHLPPHHGARRPVCATLRRVLSLLTTRELTTLTLTLSTTLLPSLSHPPVPGALRPPFLIRLLKPGNPRGLPLFYTFSQNPCSQRLRETSLLSAELTTLTLTKAERLFAQHASLTRGEASFCASFFLFSHLFSRFSSPFLLFSPVSPKPALNQWEAYITGNNGNNLE